MIKKIAITLTAVSIVFSSVALTVFNKTESAEAKLLTENSVKSSSVLITENENETQLITEGELITIPYKEIVTKKIEKTETTTQKENKTKVFTTETKWDETTSTKKETASQKETTTTQNKVTTTASVTSPDGKNLGKFKITVYTPSSDGGRWGYQTATGVTSQHLKTCAVDPKVIPLGSTIKIGNLTLLACDTGNKVKGNVVDIFYDGSSSAACSWVSNFGTSHYVYAV